MATNPAKITLANIKKYIQGWWRWILFQISKLKFIKGLDLNVLPLHKQEQFKYRLQVMDSKCLTDEKCKICGCQTPQLQMTDASCEGNCYPAMMNQEDWEKYKTENKIKV